MKVKHIPQRTCLGCMEVKGKKEMIRIVRTPAGTVEVDLTGKKSGRGAYICRDINCLEKAAKSKRLERNLEIALDQTVYDRLRRELSSDGV